MTDREVLEEWLEEMTPDIWRVVSPRRRDAIRNVLAENERLQKNYATVYENAERAEKLWMEAQIERDGLKVALEAALDRLAS